MLLKYIKFKLSCLMLFIFYLVFREEYKKKKYKEYSETLIKKNINNDESYGTDM